MALEMAAQSSCRRPRLLVVDDEPELRDSIVSVLSDEFEALAVESGERALAVVESFSPIVVLLDVMMPGMGGNELCRVLRESPATRFIQILMLTADASLPRKVEAFGLGADDFIAKPFEFDELRSRLLSKVRRSLEQSHSKSTALKLGNLEVLLEQRTALINGSKLDLGGKEFDIIVHLLKCANQLVSRASLMEAVWDDTAESDRVLDFHLVAIRKKLVGFTGRLRTVYGQGFILEV